VSDGAAKDAPFAFQPGTCREQLFSKLHARPESAAQSTGAINACHELTLYPPSPLARSFAGVNLIAGWTEGVLLMVEGERAKLHVPASKGYGAAPQGSPGGGWYLPGNSNLCFDIEILGKC